MHSRLELLLRDFRWDRMDNIFLAAPADNERGRPQAA